MTTAPSAAPPTAPPTPPDTPPIAPPLYPGGSFPTGHLRAFFEDPVAMLGPLPQQYPQAVELRFGPERVLTINDADLARHVLVTHARNYVRPDPIASTLKVITPESLFVSEGDAWLQRRRLLQPAFHRQRIAAFGTMMTDEAQAAVERFRTAAVSGDAVDVQEEMTLLTLHIVSRALFSVDMNQGDRGRRLALAFAEIAEWINHRLRSPFAPPLWFPSVRNRRMKQCRDAARAVVQQIVDERRAAAAGSAAPKDFLQMLMDARDEETGAGLSDAQIVNECVSFFFAGHETTANLLTWAWWLLASNPNAEAALHDEVDRVLTGRTPTMDDLPALPYTRHVLEETLRLYPPAWATARISVEPDRLGPYAVPANRHVQINTYGIQRSPAYFAEPDAFRPERFAADPPAHPRHAWIPFGEGPRLCIGNQFALTEGQLVLATLAQQVRLCARAGYSAVPMPVFTLRVQGSLPMRPAMRH